MVDIHHGRGFHIVQRRIRYWQGSLFNPGGQGTNSTTWPDFEVNTAKSSLSRTITPLVKGFPQSAGGLPWPSSKGGFARHHRPSSNAADLTPQWV